MSRNTYPGVYTKVTDLSAFPTITSRIRIGLLGPATKGPLNQIVPIGNLGDYQKKFGLAPVSFDMTAAIQVTSAISDGISVVRVARRNTLLTGTGLATGTANAVVVDIPSAAALSVGDWLVLTQIGRLTTPNLRVQGISGTTVTIDVAADPTVPLKSLALNDTYQGALVLRSSAGPNAANPAEAFMWATTWNTTWVGGGTVGGSPISGTFIVSGAKGSSVLTVQSPAAPNMALVSVGDILLLEQAGNSSTREVRVAATTPEVPGQKATIVLVSTSLSDVGYQPVVLQASYSGATVRKLSTVAKSTMHLFAASPGTWANSGNSASGLVVRVAPGSLPDTKKFNIYERGVLVETLDNLSLVQTITGPDGITPIPNPAYYPTAINGVSAYIVVGQSDPNDPTTYWRGTGAPTHPLNTVNGYIAANVQAPATAVAADLIAGTYVFNSAQFLRGLDGAQLNDSDYVGTYDELTDVATGLKLFDDSSAPTKYSVIACPGWTSVPVGLEIARIARVINSFGVMGVPSTLTAAQAIDWHNGLPAGGLVPGGLIDNERLAFFWDRQTVADSVTGNLVKVDPIVGYLRAAAYTFDSFKPWYAAAGTIRGNLPEAVAVDYPKLNNAIKQQFFAPGNALNPIVSSLGVIFVNGNRTLKRSNSKLQQIHVIHLVNHVLNSLAAASAKYSFDPIDQILYSQIYNDFSNILNGISNERGFDSISGLPKGFLLVCDTSNNTADDRNNKMVNVNLDIVPIDALEVLNINLNVRQSGVTLSAING